MIWGKWPTLFVFSFWVCSTSFAQSYRQEITEFFTEIQRLGAPPSVDCQKTVPEPAPESERDPRLIHLGIRLSVTSTETVEFEGQEITVLSLEQAQQLFKEFQQLDYIPTRYIDDGCYARAHELALIARANGMTFGKAHALPDSGLLTPEEGRERLPSSFAGWRYHTNAFVMVRDGDELVPMTFDLGIADRPQSFEQWRRGLGHGTNGHRQVRVETRHWTYIFNDGNFRSPNQSLITGLLEAQRGIDELGYDEYLFRLERGWL
jgi:hypothetical protein